MTKSPSELLAWMESTRIKPMTFEQMQAKRRELGLQPFVEDDWHAGYVRVECTKCGRSMNPLCIGDGEIIDWACTKCGRYKSNDKEG